MSDDLAKLKIFPRNLTARADRLVRGNPAGTRPESGVDNCYPGLEFDQRNLDKAFYPGLLFEFHRSDGAILQAVDPDGPAADAGLRDSDLPLFLWAIMGRTRVDQPDDDPPAFFFQGLGGLDAWRRVHDLLPGRIAILLGAEAGFTALGPSAGVIRALDQLRDQGQSQVSRNPDGSLRFVVLVGERAGYLSDDGVIDPGVFPPGELTRSLCSPWQYDFRDCGCFYWAANKPDLVASSDGAHPYLNFLRRDRVSDPPPSDQATMAGRTAQELGYAELFEGWNDLPVILNDRESEEFTPAVPADVQLMGRQEVIEELTYLATVEHALCVEYLFAHYSLNAPLALPEDAGGELRRIYAAAQEVFMVAVDEMRHFRWVNEALNHLGRPPKVDRAEKIGRSFNRPFELAPLTPQQLQWFIDVEAPSQAQGSSIDGMYVRLHSSIDRQPDLFPERDRLVHLMKLIIDEGEDHYQRFLSVQRHLEGLPVERYLRPLNPAGDGSAEARLSRLSDEQYAVLLALLYESFRLGHRSGGSLLNQSIRSMRSLHETNHFLAARGVGTAFEVRVPVEEEALEAVAAGETPEQRIGRLEARLESAIQEAAEASPEAGELLQRHRATYRELFEFARRTAASP